MPLTAPAPTTEPRELIPAGLHKAYCCLIATLGNHMDEYQGEKKINAKMRLGFELPELRQEYEYEGEKINSTRTSGMELTLSMGSKANLRKIVDSWRGTALTDEQAAKFDILKLAGRACHLNIIHKISQAGHPYAKIDSVIAAPADISAWPKPEREVLVYHDGDTSQFDKLPKFIREKIQSAISPQPLPQEIAHQAAKSGPPIPDMPSEQEQLNTAFDDDIPF